MPKHNRASFAPADRKDAKRGFPDFDLRGYAQERGLEFIDRRTPAGFGAVFPGEEEWRHNILRGTLAGGRHGVLGHEGLPIEADSSGEDANVAWSGTFYFTRISAGRFRVRDLFLWMIPFSEWFGSSPEAPPVHVPCTTAAVRVPEAAAALPTLRVDRRRHAPPYDFGNHFKLLPPMAGWHVQAELAPDQATQGRLFGPPVDRLFAGHTGDGLFQVLVWSSTLLVRRNGYLRDPAALDELAGAASLLADRLREACLPLADPQPFDTALPEPAWRRDGELLASFNPRQNWRDWALATCAERGLVLEDSQAYHRAFPSIPVPGLAYVVMRGEIPGFGPGRLVVHRERDSVRPAVLTPAPPGAADTPEGGIRDPDLAAAYEVRDGIQAVWSMTSFWGSWMAGDVDDFLRRAAELTRADRSPATR